MIIVYLILALYGCTVFHELGHYLTACFLNVPVLECNVGIGPIIFKYNGKKTVFILKLLPFGGLCKFSYAYSDRHLFDRLIIGLSGVTVNVVLFLFTLLSAIHWKLYLLPKSIITIISVFSFKDFLGLELSKTVTNFRELNEANISFVLVFCIWNLLFFLCNLIPIPGIDGGNAIMDIIYTILKKQGFSRNEINNIRFIVTKVSTTLYRLIFYIIPIFGLYLSLNNLPLYYLIIMILMFFMSMCLFEIVKKKVTIINLRKKSFKKKFSTK